MNGKSRTWDASPTAVTVVVVMDSGLRETLDKPLLLYLDAVSKPEQARV